MDSSVAPASGLWEWQVGITQYSVQVTPATGQEARSLNWAEDVSSWDDERGNGSHAETSQTVETFLQEGPIQRPAMEVIEQILAYLQADKPEWLDTYRLQRAVYARDMPTVETMLRKGVAPDRPIFGMTAFYLAIIGKELAFAERFLEVGVDLNRRFPHNQEPILMALAWSAPDTSWEPLIRQIIAQGADLEAPNRWGETPLMAAASVGERLPWYVPLMIEAGADVNARSLHGYTPLWKAVSYRYTPLASIQRLIAAGADVNARSCDDNGYTVLMEAVSNTLVDAVRCLLVARADAGASSVPGRKTGTPKSVLQVALDYGDPEIIRMIREAVGE